METIENALLKDLEQIEKMLENCKDDNLRKVLEEDKNKISLCLNLESTPINRSNSATFEEIRSHVVTNGLTHAPIKPIHLFRQNNNIEDKQLFDEFMKKDEFDLRQIYQNPNTYVFFSNVKLDALGKNTYIKSLNKNYINVHNTNKINDYAVLVHELGHAKLNLVHINAFDGNYSCNFSEAYPDFLKLMFFDYISDYGREKDSFNLKYSYLDEFTVLTQVLIDKLNLYKNSNDKQKRSFDYQYKLLMSNLLTMYLYNLYKRDKNECLRVLNIYINNFGLLNDNDLLEAMNIDPNSFKNLRIVSEFIQNLNKERYDIKHRRSYK